MFVVSRKVGDRFRGFSFDVKPGRKAARPYSVGWIIGNVDDKLMELNWYRGRFLSVAWSEIAMMSVQVEGVFYVQSPLPLIAFTRKVPCRRPYNGMSKTG